MKSNNKKLKRKILAKLDVKKYQPQKIDDSSYEQFSEASLSERRFYNIGAGKFKHRYWTNVDYASDHYSKDQSEFINHNLMSMEAIPVEDCSAEAVYSLHTIEHVTDDAVLCMMKEAHRILKPGGAIRLTCPDAELMFKAYQKEDIHFWYWRRNYSKPGKWESLFTKPLNQASIHQLFLHRFASQLCEIDIDDSPAKK